MTWLMDLKWITVLPNEYALSSRSLSFSLHSLSCLSGTRMVSEMGLLSPRLTRQDISARNKQQPIYLRGR